MGKKDKRVDAYIEKKAAFARPLLNHLRKVVHKACPKVEETIKWGIPHFDYQGMLCHMAAFKAHVAFGFWKGKIMEGPKKGIKKTGRSYFGQLGRMQSKEDLPPEKTLTGWIKEAMKLNEKGTKLPTKKPSVSKELKIPTYFLSALKKSKKALATFEGFSYTNKKEYVTWVTEAKQEATRDRRLKQAVEWMAQGKVRNWKYANC